MTRLRATHIITVLYDADPEDYANAVAPGEPLTAGAMARYDQQLANDGEWDPSEYPDAEHHITVEVVTP
jgi:hypothetical protein